MTEPVIAEKNAMFTPLEEGKTYYWCACGLSKNQPFCDGSHSTTDIKPVEFTATATRSMPLCGCKHTKNPPYCDGTHGKL